MPQLEWMTRRPALLSSDWKAWGLALESEQVVELSASRGCIAGKLAWRRAC
ncbi:hypothetical protein QNM99_01260 [Pseudomonas sp. PCH446]